MEHVLLTPDEVAELHRVTPADVLTLVEEGSLAGFKVIRGEWRVASDSVAKYMAQNLRKHNAEVLERALHDPERWAAHLREMPELAESIRSEQHEPGSVGEFLQDALAATESGDNVVPLRGRSDSPDEGG